MVLTYLETSSTKGQGALAGFSTIYLADIAALQHRQRYCFINDIVNITYGAQQTTSILICSTLRSTNNKADGITT